MSNPAQSIEAIMEILEKGAGVYGKEVSPEMWIIKHALQQVSPEALANLATVLNIMLSHKVVDELADMGKLEQKALLERLTQQIMKEE